MAQDAADPSAELSRNQWFRDRLAIFVTVFSLVVVAILIGIVIYGKKGAPKDMLLLILPIIGTWVGSVVAFYFGKEQLEAARESTLHVVELERRSQENPDNARYAWDLAAGKLEAYLNRNLSQVKWIFVVAILVMFCGFSVVIYGVTRALTASGVTGSLVATGAGIISQFIGVTFMVIYRSTMEQASSYMIILERINNIGMAVQILGQIPDSDRELKNATRADIVRTLALESKISAPRTRGSRKLPKPGAPGSRPSFGR